MKKELFCISFLSFSVCCSSQKDSSFFRKKQLTDTADAYYNIPVFSTGGSDAESDLDEQDVSSLLQSSRDLFTQFASFQFGTGRYRMRGYAAENQLVMINGVNVNNAETGFSTWSSWGGLNDVTRFVETRFGNGPNRYGFSGPGGYTHIDSKASSFKKGTRISYAFANRIFRNRVMLTHSTGLSKKGWALTLSASGRYGNEVYVPGTYFNASAFYASLDKKLNDKHLFSFTGFVAPVEKGLSSSTTLEAFEITGDPYYNCLWGYQNGKVRNTSVSRTKRPMLLFSHIYAPDQKRKLSTSLHCTFGESGVTGLSSHNSPNAKPDYYKHLPGYFYETGDSAGGNAAAYNWVNDVHTRQVNWDKLIAYNQANLYSHGPAEINTEETRARYILENRIENLRNYGCNIVYNERKDNLFLSLGANAFMYKNRKYKEMEDLLGATFWIDVDQFAQDLGVDPMIQQNDISQPDRKIYKGDRFGYDYIININRAELWGSAEYTFRKFDFYGSITTSQSRIWRTGKVANGKFPETSKGESARLNFLNYGFKAGGTYKISGRNFLTANITILSRAPEASNIFLSPRVRNDVVDDIKSEEVISSDLSYIAKYPAFKLRFTLYSTEINNQTWLRSYFDDTYNTLVNLIMTGVNQKHRGFEWGLEKTIRTLHSVQFVTGFSQSYYTNTPELQAWQDNTNRSLYYNRKAYLENFKIGGSPQFVSGLGYRFTARKHWSAAMFVNYFDKLYVDVNPDRRTTEAVGKFQEDEKELAHEIIRQEQLPAYFILNASVSKTFRIRKKYNLGLNLSVNNLLNNQNTLAGGYEQLRWDPQHLSRFANKYSYLTGITYMFSMNFNF